MQTCKNTKTYTITNNANMRHAKIQNYETYKHTEIQTQHYQNTTYKNKPRDKPYNNTKCKHANIANNTDMHQHK